VFSLPALVGITGLAWSHYTGMGGIGKGSIGVGSIGMGSIGMGAIGMGRRRIRLGSVGMAIWGREALA